MSVLMVFNKKNKKKIDKAERTMKHILFDLYDIFSFLVFVGGIVLFIRFFLFQPFTVVGASMYPTIHERDVLVIARWYDDTDHLKRGDVVVFVPPTSNIFFVKRVIAFPGELVKLDGGSVFVCSDPEDENSCEKLDESYLPEGLETHNYDCGIDEFLIDDKGLFVMGDNRGGSTDSRCCFTVGCYEGASYEAPFENIIGKVLFRAIPDPRSFN